MIVELVVQSGTIVAFAKSSAFVGETSSRDGRTNIVCQAQSSSLFGDHSTVTLPPPSSGVSYADIFSTGAGGIPSFIPPVGTTGPIIVALAGSCCPPSSTQVRPIQYGLPFSSCSTVLLDCEFKSGPIGVNPTTSAISC